VRKIKGALIFLLFMVFSCTTTGNSNNSGENTRLRFDGIYFYEADEYTNYLRFSQEGDVISLTSRGKYNKNIVTNWSFEYYSDAIGKYQVNNGNIIFTISSDGNIDYFGIVTNNALILNSQSNINNHEEKDITYQFRKW
jgi:hypothetical protein